MPDFTKSMMLATLVATTTALPAGAEWGGIFPLSSASHTWSMQKVGGAYADPAMKIVLIPTTDNDAHGLEETEATAATLFAGTCPETEAGETMTPAATGSCFELHVGTGDDSLYTIDTTGLSGMAVWAQHFPTEFERDRHYLYDAAGTDVEPAAFEPVTTTIVEGAEWAGVFSVATASLVWSMEKVNGAYADPAMKIVLIPIAPEAGSGPAHVYGAMDIQALETTASTLMAGTCPEVEDGESMTPVAAGSCFEMHNGANAMSTFTIAGLTVGSGLAIWTAHVPTEFENTQHYLKDPAGTDIEPLAQLTAPAVTYSKRWGTAIGAALLVNLCTLVGVLLMVPFVANMQKKNPDVFTVCANAFAAGALLSCAFYLMLFEGSHYVAVGAGSEGETAFLWGTMVLLGVLTASIIDFFAFLIMPGSMTSSDASKGGSAPVTITTESTTTKADAPAAVEMAEIETGTAPSPPPSPPEDPFGGGGDPVQRRTRIMSGVLIGDFMHNFCDGIFIGTGFTHCSDALAWGISTATIAHEIAQEFADFIVLTDPKQGNLKPVTALILNFISGLSVALGVIVIMSVDIDGRGIGCILTYGGGVYIQIGLGECMARVYPKNTTIMLKLATILMFIFGATAIGLILYGHEHCSAGGGDGHDHGGGGGDGHDHGRML